MMRRLQYVFLTLAAMLVAVPAFAQEGGHVVGLPQRQLRSAGTDA